MPVIIFFLLTNILFFSQAYYRIGIVNCVLAEHGLFASMQYAHPLYFPLLRLVHEILKAVGAGNPHVGFYQALSLVFSAGFLFLSFRLARLFLGRPLATLWILAAAFSNQFWYFSTQPTAYSAALFFLAASFSFALKEKPAVLGAAACAAIACAFTLAAIPAAALAAFIGGRQNFRRFFTVFNAAFILSCAPLAALYWREIGADLADPAALAVKLGSVPAAPWIRSSGFYAQIKNLFFDDMAWLRELWVYLAFAGFAFFSARETRAGIERVSWAFIATFLLFFFFVDAANRFKFVLVIAAALAACASAAKQGRLFKTALAASVLSLAVFNVYSYAWPASRAENDFFAAESRFLKALLGEKGLLVCAGPPDWRLAYLNPDTRKLEILTELPSSNPFAMPKLPMGPELSGKIKEELEKGSPVFLAADRLYHFKDAWSEEQVLALQEKVYRFITKNFELGDPKFSPEPLRQAYYPVNFKRR